MNLKAFGDVKQEIIEDAVLKDLLERANAEAGKYSDDDDDDESVCKRPRLQEEERVQRCRERNRVHARNTRERKRAQMELLQQRIQELSDEKRQLEEYEPDSSIASILMSLSNCPNVEGGDAGTKTDKRAHSGVRPPLGSSAAAKSFAAEAIERIRAQIAATLSDEEELEIGSEFQLRDKTQCTTQQLETIRRERNRMHAKKTRLRKKKMLTEMEAVISNLEQEIKELRRRHNLHAAAAAEADGRGGGSGSGSGLGSTSALLGPNARLPSKFTGFRHMQNKTLNGVTTISGLRGASGSAGSGSGSGSGCSGNSSVSSTSTSTHRSGSSSGAHSKSGHSSSSSSSSAPPSSAAHAGQGGPRLPLSVVTGASSSGASAGQASPGATSSVPGSTELSVFPIAQLAEAAAVVSRPSHLVAPSGSIDSTELYYGNNKGAAAGDEGGVWKGVSARCGSAWAGSTTSESGGDGSPVTNPAAACES